MLFLLAALSMAAGPPSLERRAAAEGLRVDQIASIPPGIPARVRAQTLSGVRLPEELRNTLERSARESWPAATRYGILAGGVAAGRLDLDHVCAVVREQACRPCGAGVPGEFEDAGRGRCLRGVVHRAAIMPSPSSARRQRFATCMSAMRFA